MEWSNTTIFLLMRALWKCSTFSQRYQFESKIKDFGNQCTWLSRGKCLRFKSRCLHGQRVWTLLNIKFIVIRFRWRKENNTIYELVMGRQKYCENQPNSSFWSGYWESKWHFTTSRSWIWSQERHLSTFTIVKTTVNHNRMRYNLPILVSRTLAFYFLLLLPQQWRGQSD